MEEHKTELPELPNNYFEPAECQAFTTTVLESKTQKLVPTINARLTEIINNLKQVIQTAPKEKQERTMILEAWSNRIVDEFRSLVNKNTVQENKIIDTLLGIPDLKPTAKAVGRPKNINVLLDP